MNRSLSTFKIAQLLDVNASSVANWVDQGLLSAHRTPGGHRRVVITDLIRFLRSHKMPVPDELHSPGVRILVVDDEPAVCQMVSKALQEADESYEVIVAHDGFKAGQLVATIKPDVVVLDLRMPGMDGFEVCRQIKGQDEGEHTEILAMTAFPSQEAERRIREAGATGFFPKPLDITALMEAVKAAV